ncbi:MFS transporter [Tepidibacillus fermentans]|uniref:Putative MFS family arabinose efflux permease n=1 Tax=Tepidibacillus fermentans TaxID=1281767 RepID=A0A4R3KGH2_9BACI|nr:MFS transporter [Tepidibacillus fermentans]TCS82437.1 putative MFS family arabinose efflux permease [Tepidibacillus fermentans]
MNEATLVLNQSTRWDQKRFYILVVTIVVSGFSQGLLLPLLSVLLEQQGISATFNGLSSAALYIGMLLASPFMEKPVRRFGFKPMIITGMGLVVGSMILFPLWMNFYFWIFLRFIVGIGDNALHFATQVWITSTVLPEKRGRTISLYGLSYGIGFGIGPLGLILLRYGHWVPFIVAVFLFILIFMTILLLKNEMPEQSQETHTEKRYLQVYSLAGIGLMPMFIYGFLEATLNSSFPIYGIRTGIRETVVSTLLSSFVIGSLIFQLPLGIVSDKFGRKKVLTLVTLIGGILFGLVPFTNSNYGLFSIFILAGGLVGSLYSLGLAYVSDLIPISLLPTANIIATIHFGIGSIIGPYLGGAVLSNISADSLFYLIAFVVISFAIFACIGRLIKNKRK